MTNLNELIPAPSDRLVPVADRLRLAAAAYLTRFKGSSREHTESDLRCFLSWCAERGLDRRIQRQRHNGRKGAHMRDHATIDLTSRGRGGITEASSLIWSDGRTLEIDARSGRDSRCRRYRSVLPNYTQSRDSANWFVL